MKEEGLLRLREKTADEVFEREGIWNNKTHVKLLREPFFEEHDCFSLPISILSTTDTAKIFEAKSEFNEFEIHDTSNQRLHIRFCS